MIACDADASITSDSLMAPTPVWMICRRTSVCSTLLERVHQGADGALHVALDDDVELLEPALLDAREEVVERDRAAVRQLLGPQPLVALGRELARRALVLDHPEALAGVHDAAEAQDLDRHRRPGRPRGSAPGVVGHRPHAAVDVAGHDDVATWSVPRCTSSEAHRAAARVEARLDDRARRVGARVRASARRRRRPPAGRSRAGCRCRCARARRPARTRACRPSRRGSPRAARAPA